MQQTGVVWILLAFGVFGLLHSWMASLGFKAWVASHLGQSAARMFRLFYNIFSGISFLPVMAAVAFLPDAPFYSFPGFLILAARFIQGAAAAGLLLAVLQTGGMSFLGLDGLLGRPVIASEPHLVTSGFYRWVRHPIYFFGLVFLWAAPIVGWNLLAFNIGSSLYFWIGSIYEERKLLVEFGQVYADYRDRTPAFLPGLMFGKRHISS